MTYFTMEELSRSNCEEPGKSQGDGWGTTPSRSSPATVREETEPSPTYADVNEQVLLAKQLKCLQPVSSVSMATQM
jgi:hypothetical protein